MDHIFASVIAERSGNAADIAEAKEAEQIAGKACKLEMQDDDDEQPLTPAETAADFGMASAIKPERKRKRTRHGKVVHEAWGEEDYRDARGFIEQHLNKEKSDAAHKWGCLEWKVGKQAYVQFREVAYGFQLFTYFAFHEQDVMQQDMAVKAYPCNNSLCVNPDHLFLCVERKRGKKNTNLCPLNSKGMACVNRSQEAMHAAGIAAKDEGMTDESLTAMTSFADYSRMSEEQLKAFHNTVYTPAKP